MFRYRISADENANVDGLVDQLRFRLDGSAIDPPTRALVIAESQSILRGFVENGRKLISLGSQFCAAQEVKGEGYSVQITFGPSASKSWLARLLGR